MKKFPNNTSLSLSDNQIKLFRKLKENGYFPSISAIVRFCIDTALPELLKEVEQLNDYIQNNDLFNVIKYLQNHGFTIHTHTQTIKHKPIISVLINGKNEVLQ